jgi:recombination protein RecA
MYNQGIARSGEILELGLYHSLIQRQGAEYQFRGLRIGDSLEEASSFLATHPDLAELIEQDIRRFYRAAT